MFADAELESYVEKIESCKKINNKLSYYKKATKRLKKLRSEYEELILNLTTHAPDSNSNSDSDKKNNTDESIEHILADIEKIIDENNFEEIGMTDIETLINAYLKYKKLIGKLSKKITDVKNEFNLVSIDDDEFVLTKINIDSI